jgi:1-aminocyclopropane-1-carboxylate synthase
VKALVLVNPANPTGQIVPPETVKSLLTWALHSGLHVIADEVYAFSVFRPSKDGPAFVPARQLAFEGLPGVSEDAIENRIHTLLGFSKDFSASGLRCGVLHSRCAELHLALNNLAYFCATSSTLQRSLTAVISDSQWVDSFQAERRRRLFDAYTLLTDSLDACRIPFMPVIVGMFVWIDARGLLTAPTWEAEKALWTQMFRRKAGVLLTPGRDCAAAEPGFFRACFAAADERALPLVGLRMRDAAEELRACEKTPKAYLSFWW